MKNKRDDIIRWALLIFWMILIFVMSQMSGDKSSEQSRIVVMVFSVVGLDLNTYFGDLATFIVRKGAHFTEYFILFILCYRVVSLYVKNKFTMIYCVLFVFLYACSDEFHQLFVDGRSGAFRDVIIDTSGGIASSLCTTLFNKIRIKKRHLLK